MQNKKNVLVICDNYKTTSLIEPIISDSNYNLMVTDTLDHAEGLIERYQYKTVLINHSIPGDPIALMDRLRKVSPSTTAVFFDSAASLIFEDSIHPLEWNLMTKNLELIVTLLASNDESSDKVTSRISYFTEKLCRRLKLPFKDRLNIISAAYIYDIIRYKYKDNSENER